MVYDPEHGCVRGGPWLLMPTDGDSMSNIDHDKLKICRELGHSYGLKDSSGKIAHCSRCGWERASIPGETYPGSDLPPHLIGRVPDMGYPEQGMTFNRYQRLAHVTKSRVLDFKTSIAVDALGLIGEAAEVSEHIKKILGHGHEADKNLIAKELGDVLWYVAEMASNFELSLDDIAEANIAKLKKRYPDGFSAERSLERDADDQD